MLDERMVDLKREMTEYAGLVEHMIEKSIKGLLARDRAVLQQVPEHDEPKANDWENRLDRALHQHDRAISAEGQGLEDDSDGLRDEQRPGADGGPRGQYRRRRPLPDREAAGEAADRYPAHGPGSDGHGPGQHPLLHNAGRSACEERLRQRQHHRRFQRTGHPGAYRRHGKRPLHYQPRRSIFSIYPATWSASPTSRRT